MDTFWIIGGGGHAGVVADALNNKNVNSIFIDDFSTSNSVIREDVFFAMPFESVASIICGVGSSGSMARRDKILAKYCSFEGRLKSVIHPSAIVSPSASIEPGTYIGAGVIIGPNVRVGKHCIINSGAIVEHDVHVGRNVHVATGAILTGQVVIGDSTFIGAGAIIKQGTLIAPDVVIGAGAVVVNHVAESSTIWYGVPATKRGVLL